MKRLIIALTVALATACSGNTAPSSASTPPVVPTPTTYTLNGTVTATTGGPISGATVRILDGANAGRSTTTSSAGSYSFTGLSDSIAL
jgi:hypothetical protein